MELIAAILFAGPLGYFCANRKRGLILYLAIWAVIFPIQTIQVLEPSKEAWYDTASYFVINAVILAAGIGLNALGARQRVKRRGAGANDAAVAR